MSSPRTIQIRSNTAARLRRRPPAAARQGSTRARDRAGLPWILLPVSGPAEVRLHPSQVTWSWPDAWGEFPATGGLWLIPRDRFTATAELLAEKYVFVEVYMQFNKADCQHGILADCICSCFGWTAPSVGWLHHDTVASGDRAEIHASLFEGHSLDGMFS